MSISTVRVAASYCFGDQPLELVNLGKVNFVFAPNGSGKTTISNALAMQPMDPDERPSWPVAATPYAIRVFNEAYRARVLTEHVDGIFTMGDESKEINKEIDRMKAEIRVRAADCEAWLAKIGMEKGDGGATGLLGRIAEEEASARESVFDAHKSVTRDLAEVVFKGFRNDQKKFLREARRRYSSDHELPADTTWESLALKARSLSRGRKMRAKLPGITTVSLIGASDASSIGEAVRTAGNGAFAALIGRLAHEDWVSEGRVHLRDSDGDCPFCQQEVPSDLEANLADYFAGGFDEALRTAIEIRVRVSSAADELECELVALEAAVSGDEELEARVFESAVENLRNAAGLLVAQVEEKCQHPTRSIDVVDVNVLSTGLASLLDTANEEIDRHNRIVDNAAEELINLVDDGWALLLSEVPANAAIKRLNGIEVAKRSEIAGLRANIAANEKANAEAGEAIAELERSVSNTAEVANRINRLLSAMGFQRFRLEVASAVTGGYRLVRNDGSLAITSLSEGEKSFIAFAYFWESLFGSSVQGGGTEDVIAVIDDPISSLDSGALFIVAAYIRDAALMTIEGASSLRQLIVLTHNTQFHLEAAYVNRGSKAEERRYFRLEKGLDGHTNVVDDGSTSKIRGSYPLLWDSVVVAARSDVESELVRVGVFNIIRRIIEGYFKTIGLVKDLRRPVGLGPAEERVILMFHIWADAGSHTIADDIDQTVDVGDTKHFLRLFKMYFDAQGHNAHFEMMIRASHGSDLLEPGQLFAES